MASEIRSWTRQGEAFWRPHHEAWKRSDLNQRQYCEAEGIPPKAFRYWYRIWSESWSAKRPTRGTCPFRTNARARRLVRAA